MRDPDRIDRILKKVERIWKEHPDLRLGQLFLNCQNEIMLYYMEEDELEKELDKVYLEKPPFEPIRFSYEGEIVRREKPGDFTIIKFDKTYGSLRFDPCTLLVPYGLYSSLLPAGFRVGVRIYGEAILEVDNPNAVATIETLWIM